MTDLVLTLIGPDRPGLVESLAKRVAAYGGNWLESRMAHLAGQFAGILRVEVAAESIPALEAALAELEAEGLSFVAGKAYPLEHKGKSVGEAVADRKVMDHAVADMIRIAGQQPVVTKARKSVASFKIRDGWPIGCKVTLRRERMYEFLDRLVNIAIPRIRDFRGLNRKSFDGRGNFSMGVKEQIMFPEIDFDKIDAIRGMDITITTTAKTDDEARALLNAFNFPFRDK